MRINSHNKVWLKKYDILKNYVEKHKMFPKSKGIFQYEYIGAWLYMQIKRYKEGTLRKDRLKKLKDLGFNFECIDENFEPVNSRKWDDKYKILILYMSFYGKPPRAKEVYLDIKIGLWLSWQKTQYRLGDLNTYRVEKLKSLNLL